MERLHFDLLVIDLLTNASELIPNIPALFIDGLFPVTLLLRVLVEDLLEVEDFKFLLLCFKDNILRLLVFVDFLHAVLLPLLLCLRC